MARKANRKKRSFQGLNDVSGIAIIVASLLLLLALATYDSADIPYNSNPPNEPALNWIGPVGAWVSYWLFFALGLTAYFVPAFGLAFGIGVFWPALRYLRGRWPWIIAFFVAGSGPLYLYRDALPGLAAVSDSGSPGGLIGFWLNDYFFRYFGFVGAMALYATLYLASLLFLTNFQLQVWAANGWAWLKSFRFKKPDSPFSAREKKLQKKVDELEAEARRLQGEIETAAPESPALEPEPLPEPTIRDLSVPTSSPKRSAKGEDAAPEPAPPADDEGVAVAPDLDGSVPVEEGETISAAEVAAATVDEVLGKSDPPPRPASDAGGAPAPPARKPKVRLPKAPTPSKEAKKWAVASPPKIGDYQLPSLDYLNAPDPAIQPSETKEELMSNARLMQTSLAQFGIKVELGDITKGPTITRYELYPAPGVRLERIVTLTNNITAALRAERINILAPVPGKASVGVEVPNRVKTTVMMRDLFESDQWLKTKAKIPLALGKDVYGKPIIGDLADMPHLLIAGSTGSGKSVCINSIIASLLYRFSPEELRMVMIDPKVVELQLYNSLPHLVVPVVTDPKKVILALRWVVNEMEKRYQIFAKAGVRNIHSFNTRSKKQKKEEKKAQREQEMELPLTVEAESIEPGADGFAAEVDEKIVVPRDDDIELPEKLSYIVVIVDELADLMLVAPADVEMAIARITQMARAAGIHCIIATQRPSVDVITGVIKANIPARIAFQVAAKVDSRTILDAMGADKLLGKGDMLYLPPGTSQLIRSQGVLITDEEIQSIVDFIVTQSEPSYEVEIHQQLQKPSSSIDLKADANGDGGDEEILEKCVEVIRSENKASVSLLQRRLKLGYNRAARLMDELEDRGIVGPSKGAEGRDILIDLDAADPLGEE